MAMVNFRSVTVTYFVLYFTLSINAQYNDDSDYDFNFYEDLSIVYTDGIEKEHPNTEQDDFYILTDFEDATTQFPNDHSTKNTNPSSIDFNRADIFNGKRSLIDINWYELPERIYRYTKHRIPGYDYEELDYIGAKNFQRCDDKSVWTHCLCQFTCAEPDVVDCYTPCKSGCECKEEYVFDHKTQQCLLPENCPPNETNFIYPE